MKARKLRIHAPAIAYFDKVRRCGSFREAARSLNVASSAVNRQILKLEEELGAPLFERLPSGLRLTPAGEVFTRHVIAVMQDTERVSSELDALQGLRSGHVEIATVEGVTVDLLPAVIERMRALYPNVSVGVSSLGSTAIAAQISSGNADLGLAFALQRDNDLHQLVRGHFHLGAIMLPDHPLAQLAVIHPGDIEEHGFIGLDRASKLGLLVQNTFDLAQAPYTPQVEVRYCHTAAVLAQSANKVAIVDRYTADFMPNMDLVTRPFDPAISVSACVIARPNRPLHRLAAAFEAEFINALSGRVPQGGS